MYKGTHSVRCNNGVSFRFYSSGGSIIIVAVDCKWFGDATETVSWSDKYGWKYEQLG